MIGMPRRVLSACSWNSLTMSTQASGVFGVGVEPPPESTDPSISSAINVGSSATAPRSACVIWPIFSSSVIRPRRSLTRLATGWLALRYAGEAGAASSDADWLFERA
jgi:hypothetical protein